MHTIVGARRRGVTSREIEGQTVAAACQCTAREPRKDAGRLSQVDAVTHLPRVDATVVAAGCRAWGGVPNGLVDGVTPEGGGKKEQRREHERCFGRFRHVEHFDSVADFATDIRILENVRVDKHGVLLS